MVCPHAAIRAKVYDPAALAGAPATFKSDRLQGQRVQGPEVHDPGRARGLHRLQPVRRWSARPRTRRTRGTRRSTWPRSRRCASRSARTTRSSWTCPSRSASEVKLDVKGSQFLPPLFEYSGACAGCGETPYVKLLTQLFGDRAADRERHRLLVDLRRQPADDALHRRPRRPRPGLVELAVRGQRRVRPRACGWRSTSTCEQAAGAAERPRLAARRQPGRRRCSRPTSRTRRASPRSASAWWRCKRGARRRSPAPRRSACCTLADYLVRKSVWIVGGDGWAYDIGYGGLDHVLSMRPRRQRAGARHRGLLEHRRPAVEGHARWAPPPSSPSAGKETAKKDLGLMAMAYGHVYVARVAFGAKDAQTRARRSRRPRAIPGPSLIIAYSHCIAHGYDMAYGAEQQKLAVDSGVWPLYRFDPRRTALGEPPLALDSGAPKISAQQYMRNETRFRMVEKLDPERFKKLLASAERQAKQRVAVYEQLSALTVPQIRTPSCSRRRAEPSPSPSRRSTEPEGDMDLTTTLSRPGAAAPADARRLAAGGRPRHGAPARGRRRRGDRHALAVRGADHPRAGGAPSSTPSRTASPSPRRSPTSRAPRPSTSAPTSTSSTCAA